MSTNKTGNAMNTIQHSHTSENVPGINPDTTQAGSANSENLLAIVMKSINTWCGSKGFSSGEQFQYLYQLSHRTILSFELQPQKL